MKNMWFFKGQVIIITGASSGIGKQLAMDLAKRKAILVLVSRSKQNLKKVLENVKKFSSRSMAIACDVSNYDRVKQMVKTVYDEYDKIDVLINNAGIGIYAPLEKNPIKDADYVMNVNYGGTLYCTKQVLPIMFKQKSGHILNVSSIAGLSGHSHMAVYCASKFAVVGLSESLYHEIESKGIHVSVVCPGATKTNFLKQELFKDAFEANKKMMSTEKVSKAILKVLITKKFLTTFPLRSKFVIFVRRISLPIYMRIIGRMRKE